MTFEETYLSDEILDALDAMHFTECTPIQEQSIDLILDGRDLIACAQTGTGKTAAYLLPTIDMLSAEPGEHSAIRCVVMVPTHELAQQIDRQLAGFSYYLPISSVAIHGGTDGKEFARQQKAITSGADVVIATPGRLLAHMKMGYVDLSHVEYFILDEADRMLDMGFYDDIYRIATQLPRQRQTLMFSATMPPKIQQLAKSILNDPAEVKIAVSKPTDKIDQSAYILGEGQKETVLREMFRHGPSKRVIVFAASKLKVKDLNRSLRKEGWKTGEMHSDLDQPTREAVMNDFRAGRIDILVATDVVARGIDIQDIAMVVNFDVPHEAEDYVHRVGRTARAGAEGRAVTLVNEKDRGKFKFIERFLGYEVKKNPLPEGMEAPTQSRNHGDRKKSYRGKKVAGKKQNFRNKKRNKKTESADPTPVGTSGNGGTKSGSKS